MRRKFLTSSKLQMRYMRVIILSLMLPTFIVGGCMYYLTFSLLAQHIAIPEFIAQILFPVLRKINFILLFFLPLVFMALVVEGAFISHRFVGPLERLRKEIEDISKADTTKRISLRKNDDLKPVAESINRLLDRMGKEGRGEKNI